MAKTSRFKTTILVSGAAVIILAVLLFLNAMTMREFSPPGEDFFTGPSNLRLALAFLLQTGLAAALLFLLALTGRSATEAPQARKRATMKPQAPEEAAHAAVAPEGNAAAPAGVLSDTAGELRTSVDVIQEELEEILDDEAPADKEHMQSLYEETDRLKKIIASMEQLSCAQEIARSLKKEPLQLEALLKDIVERTKLANPDKAVTYTLECQPGLVMQGDAECISRILENVMDNAARFMKGPGTVTLTAERSDGAVRFSVQDTGPGIRRSQVSHLYERFFRGTGSGIGMGLSIAKELVDACGGRIEVQTALGKGTTFTVQVPEQL